MAKHKQAEAPRAAPCRTTAYARAVVAGDILAGRLVRLACERHLRDLETGHERGLKFDSAAAARVIEFFERFLCLNGGEFEGTPFELQPFQAFIIGSLFGWKGADGYRRFRSAFIEMAKGNGKSPLVAGIGLKCLMADDEPRAEVYAAATKKDQAMILFRDAVAMVDQSPLLGPRLQKTGAGERTWNLAHAQSGSWFRPISSDDGQSGPRPHCALIDEVHEHKTPHVIDMMRAGTKGRRQALIVEITNSGFNRHSVCWHHHEYSAKVLEGQLENDAWFAYICQLDVCAKCVEEGKTAPADGCPDCDDWRDESVWAKANPNLGVSVPLKYLREQVREAEGIPAKESVVKRLNFCIWTEARTVWLPAATWAKGNIPVDARTLRGRCCTAAIDVANREDINAFVLLFHSPDERAPGEIADVCASPPDAPPAEGPKTSGVYRLMPFFWIPRECALEKEKEHKVPYTLWERQGFLMFTEGDVIDLNAIEAFIKRQSEVYDIAALGYDPWNATQLATNLQAWGIKVIEFGQNLRNFNEPTKEFQALLRRGRIHHGGHPVLSWMAGNCEVLTDASGNIRPVKPEHGSAKKIDGIVGAVMALGVSMQEGDGGSVYDTRGIEMIDPEWR